MASSRAATSWRRSVLATAGLALGLMVAMEGPALGATVIRETGTHGSYTVIDQVDAPGARCRYEGAAGTYYLRRVTVRNLEISGTSTSLRSVGYRMLLQRLTATGWKTVQRGPLVSAPASTTVPAELQGTGITRDLDVAPNSGRYRAALKLIWWTAVASVQGTVTLAIEHHRRTYDGSVGASCRGRVVGEI